MVDTLNYKRIARFIENPIRLCEEEPYGTLRYILPRSSDIWEIGQEQKRVEKPREGPGSDRRTEVLSYVEINIV